MADRTTPCRVCGKPFTPCNKTSAEIGAFNYREVACSMECGKEYLRRVMASRNTETDNNVKQEVVEPKEILQEKENSESAPISPVATLRKVAKRMESKLDDIEM